MSERVEIATAATVITIVFISDPVPPLDEQIANVLAIQMVDEHGFPPSTAVMEGSVNPKLTPSSVKRAPAELGKLRSLVVPTGES